MIARVDGPGDELEDMYSDELAEGDADAAAEGIGATLSVLCSALLCDCLLSILCV